MNLKKAQEEFGMNYEIDLNAVSKSQRFLLVGGNGLKIGDKVSIPAQKIGMGQFDLGANGKSEPTPCVLGEITQENGKTRVQMFSLGQLKRRSYGTELRTVSGNPEDKDFPNVDVHSGIDLIIKNDEEAKTSNLVAVVNFTVIDNKNHYFAKFDNKEAVKNPDGTLALEGKRTMIFKGI